MTKLSMLGIVGGAALLAAVPFSLQWSQENVGPAVPLLTLYSSYFPPSCTVEGSSPRTWINTTTLNAG